MPIITAVDVVDVRFPTSLTADGSDAMNKDGDYSAAYVVLRTDADGVEGYGLTFTIGRGNDLVALAAQQRGEPLVGLDVDEVVADLGGTYRRLQSDTQLRWLGPDKGVEHLAMAANGSRCSRRRATPATPRRPAGSATATRSSAGSARRPSTRATAISS